MMTTWPIAFKLVMQHLAGAGAGGGGEEGGVGLVLQRLTLTYLWQGQIWSLTLWDGKIKSACFLVLLYHLI